MSETKTKKAILIKTDGYEIDHWFFDDVEQAKKEMKRQYDSYYPEELEEEWADDSYCSDDYAILYNNGEDVFVWRVFAIQN